MDAHQDQEQVDGTNRPRHILLGVSGSVATIKVLELIRLLSCHGQVRLVSTQHARHFFTAGGVAPPPAAVPESNPPPPSTSPPPLVPLPCRHYSDEDEWASWQRLGDPVLHIELRRWADVLVIAPLSANTLAKMAQGLCDNLLTSIVRAWDFASKPVLVAPAMNTYMWESVFTARHLSVLRELRVDVINPVEKRLACDEVGVGGMASPSTIADRVASILASLRDREA